VVFLALQAVIADYCPGARSEAGFASFVILSGSASTIMFFIIPLLKAPRTCLPVRKRHSCAT
jgi:hypothetical protein